MNNKYGIDHTSIISTPNIYKDYVVVEKERYGIRFKELRNNKTDKFIGYLK